MVVVVGETLVVGQPQAGAGMMVVLMVPTVIVRCPFTHGHLYVGLLSEPVAWQMVTIPGRGVGSGRHGDHLPRHRL